MLLAAVFAFLALLDFRIASRGVAGSRSCELRPYLRFPRGTVARGDNVRTCDEDRLRRASRALICAGSAGGSRCPAHRNTPTFHVPAHPPFRPHCHSRRSRVPPVPLPSFRCPSAAAPHSADRPVPGGATGTRSAACAPRTSVGDATAETPSCVRHARSEPDGELGMQRARVTSIDPPGQGPAQRSRRGDRATRSLGPRRVFVVIRGPVPDCAIVSAVLRTWKVAGSNALRLNGTVGRNAVWRPARI